MMLEAERAQVAAAARRMAQEGLVVGSAGNVGLRLGERLLISGTGTRLGELEPAGVSVVDLRDGTRIDGPDPSTELPLHREICARTPANAIVHTHSRMATALACVLEDEVPLVHYTMLMLGGAVPIAPYRQFGSAELAEVTVAALDGGSAVLMAGHGAITLGAGLEEAVERAVLLEWACGVYWHARALGTPRMLDSEQQRVARAAIGARTT